MLVIANEDYSGVNPEPAPFTNPGPKYLDEHVDALAANGIAADSWDVDAQGVPHDLGVLSHYDAVLWYLGDNRLTQDPEDELTELPLFGLDLPDSSVAERQQYLTIAVRDYLNEGGKLIHSGETTAYYGLLNDLLGGALAGIYYGLDGAPDQPCLVDFDPFSDCLLLADDFAQYYLGAYSRTAFSATGVEGTAGPMAGDTANFGGPATVDNPIDEAGGFRLTSTILPPDQFPQFASSQVYQYLGVAGTIDAVEGEVAVAAEHVDDSYMRLGREFDLTGCDCGRPAEVRGPTRLLDRAGLRLRDRRSPHSGAGQLDDAPRPQRRDHQRRADSTASRASCCRPTPTCCGT